MKIQECWSCEFNVSLKKILYKVQFHNNEHFCQTNVGVVDIQPLILSLGLWIYETAEEFFFKVTLKLAVLSKNGQLVAMIGFLRESLSLLHVKVILLRTKFTRLTYSLQKWSKRKCRQICENEHFPLHLHLWINLQKHCVTNCLLPFHRSIMSSSFRTDSRYFHCAESKNIRKTFAIRFLVLAKCISQRKLFQAIKTIEVINWIFHLQTPVCEIKVTNFPARSFHKLLLFLLFVLRSQSRKLHQNTQSFDNPATWILHLLISHRWFQQRSVSFEL